MEIRTQVGSSPSRLENLRRKLKLLYARERVYAEDIVKVIQESEDGCLYPGLPLSLGMSEEAAQGILNRYTLREDIKPIESVTTVKSINSWPWIYRYMFLDGRLLAVIIEVGLETTKFVKFFSLLKHRLDQLGAAEFMAEKSDGSPYDIFIWESKGLYNYLQVISDKVVNLSPMLLDRDYFGYHLDGTFARVPGRAYEVLPTVAFAFSADKAARSSSFLYLQQDLRKRAESVKISNLFSLL
jgi:hypothetical protein